MHVSLKTPLYGEVSELISLAKQYNGIVHPKDESDIIIFVSENSEYTESLNIQVMKDCKSSCYIVIKFYVE